MELRRLTSDDQKALKRLMAEAFGGGSRPSEEEPSAPPQSLQLGVLDGSRLVAAATVHDLHLTWGDHDAPMGGVAGAMSLACSRSLCGRCVRRGNT